MTQTCKTSTKHRMLLVQECRFLVVCLPFVVSLRLFLQCLFFFLCLSSLSVSPSYAQTPVPKDRSKASDLFGESPNAIISGSQAADPTPKANNDLEISKDAPKPEKTLIATEKPLIVDEELISSLGTTSGRKSLGILDLEEHIARDLYQQNSSLNNRSVLVQVYEKMALGLCFPSLNALVAGGKIDLSSDCNEILSELEKLHSNNSLLICARKGIDSVDCSQAFEKQQTRKAKRADLDIYTSISSNKDPVDSAEGHKRFLSLQKDLMTSHDKFKSSPSLQNLKELEISSFPILSLICSTQMLELSTTDPKNNRKQDGSKSIASLADSIDFFESSLGLGKAAEEAAKPDAPENPTEFFKSRLLTDRCYDTISDLVSIDQRLPSPICFRDSFISPSCLSALRRFRSLKEDKPQNLPSPTPKDSLSSF